MDKIRFYILAACIVCAGCASTPKPAETVDQQVDAAQKVMGGMAGREVSRDEFRRTAQDIQKNEDSRSAVRKIVGADGPGVVKYSPVTGKHYSGDLDVDPETGVKLKVLPE